jgi:hypothetical protein
MTHHRRPCTSANRRGSLPRQFGHLHHICIRQARRQGTSSTAANRKARECGLVYRFSTTFQSVAVLAFSGAHAGFPNRAPAGRSRESGAHQPTIRKREANEKTHGLTSQANTANGNAVASAQPSKVRPTNEASRAPTASPTIFRHPSLFVAPSTFVRTHRPIHTN